MHWQSLDICRISLILIFRWSRVVCISLCPSDYSVLSFVSPFLRLTLPLLLLLHSTTEIELSAAVRRRLADRRSRRLPCVPAGCGRSAAIIPRRDERRAARNLVACNCIRADGEQQRRAGGGACGCWGDGEGSPDRWEERLISDRLTAPSQPPSTWRLLCTVLASVRQRLPSRPMSLGSWQWNSSITKNSQSALYTEISLFAI